MLARRGTAASMASPRNQKKDLVLTLVAMLALDRAMAHALDVTSCETTVRAGETGVVQLDLDCPTSSFAVRLLRGATLDLNGHALRGGDVTRATVLGVAQEDTDDPLGGTGRGKFTIVGPGEISGTIHPPFLTNGTRACVLASDGRVRITSSTGIVDIHHCGYAIRGSDGEQPEGNVRIDVDHIAVHDTVLGGIAVRNMRARQSSAYSNPGIGMGAARRMLVADVTADDNAIGFFAGKVMKGTNISATNNSFNGVDSCGFGAVVLTNLVASGNTHYGVCADRIRLTDSTVTDNADADLFSIRLPRLTNTTCGTSQGLDNTTQTWGVCANDP